MAERMTAPRGVYGSQERPNVADAEIATTFGQR
jgi:hypothetical protein